MFGNLSSSPEAGTALQTLYTITYNLTQPFPAPNKLWVLFSYIPVNAAMPAPALASSSGYPQLTSEQEVAIAYETVNLTCDNTSPPDCFQAINITTYLPPGLYQFVLHIKSTESDVADVYYSNVPAVVGQPELLGTGTTNPLVCGLLTGDSTDDPLTQASLLSTITSTLVAGYGSGGLTANSSDLDCDSFNNTDGSSGFANNNSSDSDATASVADRLLSAMLNVANALTASGSPLAVNVANSLSSATFSIVSSLKLNGTGALASPPISSAQVYGLLNLTSSIESYLSTAGVGYQSGNNSAAFTFNTAFNNLAGIYGELLTANTSDPSQHCQLVGAMEDRFSSLLTTAMTGHDTTDPDVAFSSPAYSAATTRISSDANSTVGWPTLSIPSSAFDGTSESAFDVQRVTFAQSQTSWSSCFPSSIRNQQASGSSPTGNLTGAALLPSPLYVLTLLTPSGSVFSVQGLADPIQFELPLAGANSSTFTPGCAFYNRTSAIFSTDGCTSVVNNASVSCACTHLTEFTLISQPLSGTQGNGQAQLSASQAAKHADLLGIFIIYLIPLVLSSYLLVVSAVLYRTQVSPVPWAKTIYAVIALVAAMRCVCLALLYFDNANMDTTAFDQNALSATTTSLLLIPLIAEVLLLALLGYRYAIVRRKEGASQMVNGKIDLRRASVYTGPASLMPPLEEAAPQSGRRKSVMQRLSVAATSETPITEPPSHIAPAVFAAVFAAATASAVVAYLVLEKDSQSSRTFKPVSALFALAFLAALAILAVWVLFLYKSVPNLKALMRRGQTLGWVAVFAFFLQSILVLSFAEQRSGSWYLDQSSGVHVMTAVYAIVEIFTLCGCALWWRWTLQWWRTNQVKNLVSRYDSNEANATNGTRALKEKEVWNGNNLSTPLPGGDKSGDAMAQRDRLDAKRLGAQRPSIAESMIFSAETEDGTYANADTLVDTAASNKTQPVVTSIEGGLEAGKAEDVKAKYAEEKTNDTNQVFSPEVGVRSLPTFSSTTAASSDASISPTNVQLQAVTASLLTARPMSVWSNHGSIASTPSQFAVVDGPMTTPLQLGNARNPTSSISASPLVMADDASGSSSGASSMLPSAAATPLVVPDTSRTLLQRQSSLTNWELTPAAATPAPPTESAAASELVPASPRINPATTASLPSPVGPMTALSMLSGSSAAPAPTVVPALEALPALPTLDDLAASTDSTVPAERPRTPPTPLAVTSPSAATTASQPTLPNSPPIAAPQSAASAAPVIATPGGLITADGRSIQLNITIQANDLQRMAGKKKVKRSVSRAQDEEPLSPFAIPAHDNSSEQKEQPQRQGEPSPLLTPRVEREQEPAQPASPMLLPAAAAPPAGVSRHGHIIHTAKHVQLTREPIVHPDGTFELSAPLASATSSGATSPSLSPSFKPSNPSDSARSRGRVSRSSVSAIPSEEQKMSPSLAAASAVYAQRRPSIGSHPEGQQRGSIVRSGSPLRQPAQQLQPREVLLKQKQSPALTAQPSPAHTGHSHAHGHHCKSCSMSPAQLEAAGIQPADINSSQATRTFRSRSNSASSASRSGDESGEDELNSPRLAPVQASSSSELLNPPRRNSRSQSPSPDSPAAASAPTAAQTHARLASTGGRVSRAASTSAQTQHIQKKSNNFFE